MVYIRLPFTHRLVERWCNTKHHQLTFTAKTFLAICFFTFILCDDDFRYLLQLLTSSVFSIQYWCNSVCSNSFLLQIVEWLKFHTFVSLIKKESTKKKKKKHQTEQNKVHFPLRKYIFIFLLLKQINMLYYGNGPFWLIFIFFINSGILKYVPIFCWRCCVVLIFLFVGWSPLFHNFAEP